MDSKGLVKQLGMCGVFHSQNGITIQSELPLVSVAMVEASSFADGKGMTLLLMKALVIL